MSRKPRRWVSVLSTLFVAACSRLPSRPTPQESRVAGDAEVAHAWPVDAFRDHFSDIVAGDTQSRAALLQLRATEADEQRLVLIGVDDGRVLDQASMPRVTALVSPSQAKEWLEQDGVRAFLQHLATMARRAGATRAPLEPNLGCPPSWRPVGAGASEACAKGITVMGTALFEEGDGLIVEIDFSPGSDKRCFARPGGSRDFEPAACRDPSPTFPIFEKTTKRHRDGPEAIDVCVFLRLATGKSKKVQCFDRVWEGAMPLCDGDVCALWAQRSGPLAFSLVNREKGDVLGTGELQASILDSVATRGSRVALRFGGALRAVVDLKEEKIFDRAADPGATVFYDEPFVWFGDDELLSCEHDPEADWRRPCRRFERVALADPSKWLTRDYNVTFEFAKKR